MMKNYRTVCFLMVCFLLTSQIVFTQSYSYDDSWGNQGVTLVENQNTGVKVVYSTTDFYMDNLDLKGEQMKTVRLPEVFLPNNEGAPDLPGYSKMIAIPQGAAANINILSMRTETIKNVVIAPAPRIPTEKDDGPLYYEKNSEIYSKNAYYPAQPVQLSETTQIRGVDVVTIGITPFQYNPVTKELIIIRDIELEIKFIGGNGTFGDNRLRSRYWDPILHENILNASILPKVDYNKKTGSGKSPDYEYLIIIPNDASFIQWADSIKNWRTLQGIKTGVVTTTEIGGNTVAAIESYVDNAYNTWDVPPSAVLLMADYGTSGASIISQFYTHPAGYPDFVSDNRFADVNGDELPEMAFARMTANNASQLQVMVTKFLDYERNPPSSYNFYDHPITALGWQTERWFQICSEAVGGYFKNVHGKNPVRINAIYSGTPGTTWSTATNTSTVVNYFGPSGLGYIPATPAELGGWSGGTATDVVNAINSGSFMLQHRDHGYYEGWGEPSFSSTNINSLTNVNNQLPYIFSINCQTGAFHRTSETFTEKFHRHTYGGQNSGALGVMAATEVSYSFVNDTYLWGVMDNMFSDFLGYTSTFPVNYVMPAFGNAAGKHFLYSSSWPYNTGDKLITYRLFHHHGDAFMTLYTEVPQYLSVTHSPTLLAGATSFTVTANSGSFIALTVNGEIIGTANGTGAPVAISIPAQNVGDDMIVTVTKQNYYRYSSTVSIIPASGPHVAYNSHIINDAAGNGNGLADFGEFIQLHTTLENVGSAAANNVTATLVCTDSYVTLTDNYEVYATINAGTTKTINNAFGFSLANNVPDQYIVDFELQMTGNADDTWTSYFSIDVNAPVLDIEKMTIDDSEMGNGDGKLDIGETADIIIETTNNGNSNSPIATGYLSSISPYVTVNTSTYPIGVINTGATVYAIFNITIDGATSMGQSVDLNFEIVAGSYLNNQTFYENVGLLVEDWETGDFSKFDWEFGGNANWTITTEDPYEMIFCAKSGSITDSQTSSLILTGYVSSPGALSFYRKVSSESNYDYLRFYIDGSLQEQWAGTVSWSQVNYSVSAGEHTFMWSYYKDGSVSTGSDCAWVDYIVFPAMTPPPAPPEIEITPTSFYVTLPQDGETDKLLHISNLGEQDLNYSTFVNYLSESNGYNPNFKLGKIEKETKISSKEELSPYKQIGNTSSEAIGDILMDLDVETPTGDNQLLGCEFDGTYLWFSGGYLAGSNQLYKLDINGNLMNTYAQNTTSDWGIRDMTFDGTYLYGGDEDGFYRITPSTGAVTTMFTGNLGLGCIRAVAYNPNNGHFYATNWDSQIIEFSSSGTTFATLTTPGLVTMYGMAYDEATGNLWIYDRTGSPQTSLYEYNLTTQALTGASMQVPMLSGLTDQMNGGLFYSTGLVPGKIALGGIVQGTDIDKFFAIELGDLATYSWLSVANNGTGNIPPGNSMDVTVHFDATGLALGTYTGEVQVSSNDPDEPVVIVSCTLFVGGYNVTGHLNYSNAIATPMDACTVMLYDDADVMVGSTTTDGNGYYEFTGIADGNYSINLSTTKPWGGLSMNDVQIVWQSVTGVITALTGLDFLAGDVTWNTVLAMDDVQLMRQVVSNYPPGTVFNSPDYIYIIPVLSVSGGDATQDIQVICSGDTDKSYDPPAGP